MLVSLAILFGAQLIGEMLRQALHLPLPGPVIGMFLLAAGLVIRDRLRAPESEATPSPLTRTANTLIGNMGLLFVPAGVGVMAELGVLRQDWLPILAALIISTVLGVVVTGLVMHHVSRSVEAGR
ncbi:MAG TPA: CidA/LrgA family protein [Acetobacteraceae bacterium]|jgi:holin-like protein